MNPPSDVVPVLATPGYPEGQSRLPMNHRYKVGQHLWWSDPLGFPRYLGRIVALFAPGNYFVQRASDGVGCITTEEKLDQAGVVVNDTHW